MPNRVSWYGKAGLFLTDDEVEEVAGTLNVLCDRLDCDDEDQAVVDASALCLRLVQGLTGILPTVRPAEVPPVLAGEAGPIVEVHRAGINWYAVIVYSALFCLGAMTGWLVWG